jgi:inorganic pyrophosphatase
MTSDAFFWHAMAELLITNTIIIDRPKGRAHPRYPDLIYPLDYGYLKGTTSADGDGTDIWLGSLNTVEKMLTGILCTFDTLKRDIEINLLIGCNEEDIQIIRDFLNEMHMLYIPNPMVENDLPNRFS